MKTLSIKNVPETLHERLKKRARHNHRSLNGELLALLERAVDEESGYRHEGNLADFLLNSPLREADIELERDRDKGREVEL
ncbi:MAG: Arc family DNA-binding protein [Gemmatimonadetes bacterium]|jgi:plasmid stability protein|nr:Arc family DNA-binding protein [Gemmatimonadota bacterium]